jgi:hypothetical protein
MTLEAIRIVNAVLREMPLDDQLASLICCIIQRRAAGVVSACEYERRVGSDGGPSQ